MHCSRPSQHSLKTPVGALGLVLAAFPLVVSALKHYNEGLKPLKDFVRYQKTIHKLVRELETEREQYRNTLEGLLSGIVDRSVDMDLFLDNPRGREWRNDNLDKKLRLLLQGSFGVYMESMEEMETYFIKLQDRIGLDEGGKV